MSKKQDRDDERRAEVEALYEQLDEARSIAEDAKDHRDFYYDKLDRVGARLAEVCEGLAGSESAEELREHLFHTLYELDNSRFMKVWTDRQGEI